ncbi:hypothetical protein C8T65DRAFT_66942 [Cerioporus squamosus]|nr:hypothetical protein C8T65DRAFT_66942 [Cerioporus squamosus]
MRRLVSNTMPTSSSNDVRLAPTSFPLPLNPDRDTFMHTISYKSEIATVTSLLPRGRPLCPIPCRLRPGSRLPFCYPSPILWHTMRPDRASYEMRLRGRQTRRRTQWPPGSSATPSPDALQVEARTVVREDRDLGLESGCACTDLYHPQEFSDGESRRETTNIYEMSLRIRFQRVVASRYLGAPGHQRGHRLSRAPRLPLLLTSRPCPGALTCSFYADIALMTLPGLRPRVRALSRAPRSPLSLTSPSSRSTSPGLRGGLARRPEIFVPPFPALPGTLRGLPGTLCRHVLAAPRHACPGQLSGVRKPLSPYNGSPHTPVSRVPRPP